MKLATASQMRALDEAASKKYNIPSLTLMENAGRGVAEAIAKRFSKGMIAIFVGKGNNGGDGLVAARYLRKAGFDVSLYLLSPWTEFSPDARVNWDRLADVKGIAVHDSINAKDLEKAVCIVDAIFGTGLSQEVKGKYKSAIDLINSLSKPVIAIDIPSGLSADTGKALGVAIRAKLVVTLGLPKLGFFIGHGHEYAREVEILDIGFPKELIEKTSTGYQLITKELFAPYLGKRPSDSHKGDFGHVLVLGGSSGKIGAGLLASRAALRVGAGLVTYALPAAAYAKFDTRSPEVMYEGLADGGSGHLTKASLAPIKALIQERNVIAIGPGIGTADETMAVVLDIAKKAPVPMVIDADGLNCLVGKLEVIGNKKTPVIITPHPGEMAKLMGTTTNKIQENRIESAKALAKKYRIYVVLKGHRTVVANPAGDIFINPTGNPGMATAGTGDVLTGAIAGLIAQKIPVEAAVIAGVYFHGLAGDMASKEMGERGLIASDVINELPRAMKESLSSPR